jgi:hypothetical protein
MSGHKIRAVRDDRTAPSARTVGHVAHKVEMKKKKNWLMGINDWCSAPPACRVTSPHNHTAAGAQIITSPQRWRVLHTSMPHLLREAGFRNVGPTSNQPVQPSDHVAPDLERRRNFFGRRSSHDELLELAH